MSKSETADYYETPTVDPIGDHQQPDRDFGQPTSRAPRSYLTSRDYTLLEGHLARIETLQEGVYPGLRRLIRAKLDESRVVLSEDIDDDIATGNSRLVFLHDGRRETRTLTHWHDQIAVGLALPVSSFLGLTLLGMREGHSAPLPRADGSRGTVTLQRIAYQPERICRQRRRFLLGLQGEQT